MLLAIVAVFFAWQAMAGRETPIPPMPAALAAVVGSQPAPTETLPEADPKTREEKRFARYDKDQDGAITREEYLANRRKFFARLDLNHNGTLEFDEYAVKAGEKFTAADKDKSGAMTPAEFLATAVKRKPKPAAAKCPPVQRDTEDEAG